MNALPPYGELLGLVMREEAGRLCFAMPFHADVVGRPGFLHGGAIAGLLEFAAYGALRHSLGEEAVELKPVSLSIDFLRGGTARETRAVGIIKRLGKRIANVEANAWQEDEEKPIATARMTVLLRRSQGTSGGQASAAQGSE